MNNLNEISKIGSDELYDILKNDMLNLKLIPGQKISENDIAKKYNVTRTTIRSAFSRLKNEKLLEVFPQIGSFVSLLDMQDINNMAHIRVLVEYDTLIEVIDKLKEDLLEKLSENLEQQKDAVSRSQVDPLEIIDLDAKYHQMFFEFVDRKSMWDLIRSFQISYTRYRLLNLIITRDFEDTYKEHLDLFNAVKGKNKEGIRRIINNHVNCKLKFIDTDYKNYFKHN